MGLYQNRIVVKVGTSTLTNEMGKSDLRSFDRLACVLSDIQNMGYEVILVSSGAIAVGTNKLNMKERPSSMRMKQAAAAVGQCSIMFLYDKFFNDYDKTIAQILLNAEDMEQEEKKENLSDIELKIWNAIEANLDSITKSQKYVFKISDAIKYFNLNEMTSGIVLSIMAIISIAFTIIIANPLIVAGKRYFIKAREKSSTKISVLGEIFKNKNWTNISVTIFLKDIYNFLWYFTIIGRIYKEL